MNLATLIVSFISGIFSIIGSVYSFKSNVYSVFVSAQKIEALYGNSVKVIISLTNESSNGVELTNLKLLKNGKQIYDNGYDYQQAREDYEKSNNIRNSILADINDDMTSDLSINFGTKEQEQKSGSNNFSGKWLLSRIGVSVEFSYWIDKDQIPDTVEITTNKRLRLFSKTKQYSIF